MNIKCLVNVAQLFYEGNEKKIFLAKKGKPFEKF
jgi:hypothetical protein